MQNWLGETPNWMVQAGIGAVLGAVLGLALPVLWRAACWVVNRRRRDPLHGFWYCSYISTFEGEEVFKSERWHIRRTLSSPLALSTESVAGPSIKYKGRILRENHHLLVEMKSISNFTEKVYIRFLCPTSVIEKPLVGVGVQYDYDGNPEATVNVLWSDKVSKNDFLNIVKKRVTSSKDLVLIRCR